ncbi:MAG: proton-conducting transporter membrane subunit [Chloroflexota bacterium]
MIEQHLPIIPILIPLIGAMVVLLIPQQAKGWIATTFMIASAAVSGWLLTLTLGMETPLVFHSGGWELGGVPMGITLVADRMAAFFLFMSQLVLVMGFIYALGCRDKVVQYPTFYSFFLTLGTGLSGTFLTGDLFNFFVFAELLVISGAILTALSDDKWGVEAAYKYFYMSLIAAAFLLLACGLLYVSYGTLNMAQLADAIAQETPITALIGCAILLAAFLIKGAGFPFHFWQPDFHTAAPTPVHAVLSSVVVKVGIYGVLRLTTLLFVEQAALIQGVLIVSGLIGLFYGGLGAVGTYDAKRMLAYSTMGQLGFILVGIGWGTPLGYAAALVFAFNHSLAKAAMLMLAGTIASRAPIKSAEFNNVTGVGSKHPMIGLLFLIGGLALAGIPPTNGFVSKLLLFESGLAGERFITLGLIGLGSGITLVYVIRAFMTIWFKPPADKKKIKPSGDRLIAPALLILLVLGLGIWAQPLIDVATATVAQSGDATNYIASVIDLTRVVEVIDR